MSTTPATPQHSPRATRRTIAADLGVLAVTAQRSSDLLEQTTALLAQAFAADYCGVLQLLPDSDLLSTIAAAGPRQHDFADLRVPLLPGMMGAYSIAERAAVVTNDTRQDGRFVESRLLAGAGLFSAMSVPIPGDSRPCGIVITGNTHRCSAAPC